MPYLGHIVSRNGVSTDPEKTIKVSTWPTPTTVLEVQKFLGLASYYRWFIKNYATISSPLHKLTERSRQFKWTDECAQAFSGLKHVEIVIKYVIMLLFMWNNRLFKDIFSGSDINSGPNKFNYITHYTILLPIIICCCYHSKDKLVQQYTLRRWQTTTTTLAIAYLIML